MLFRSLLADRRGAAVRDAALAEKKVTEAQQLAGQQLGQVQALKASLASQKKKIDAMVKEQQALVALTKQQAQAAAAQAAAQARAVQQARVSRSQPRPPVVSQQVALYTGPASGRAAAAVKYAYAQLGKPYHWAGAGPYSFDCSGLTMRAWQAAGVSLSHNAAAQYYSTRHVSLADLQPGDLIYFGHPIHHVGIYIGGGRMIEAPYTGADVRITAFGYRHDIAGASRP